MTEEQPIEWATCSESDCIGSRVTGDERCIAHLADQDPDAFDAELKRIAQQGSIDARGVQLSHALVTSIFGEDTLLRDRLILQEALFDRATFQGRAPFRGVTFQRRANFEGATFQGDTDFHGAMFQGGASFARASFHADVAFSMARFQHAAAFIDTSFQGKASFWQTIFHDRALFHRATFQRDVSFPNAWFQGEATFEQATFKAAAGFGGAGIDGVANFVRTTFEGAAGFPGTRFKAAAGFHWARFEDLISFEKAIFGHDAWFNGVVFESAREFGPMLVRRSLGLDDAVFQERIRLEVAAAAVCAQRARFVSGVQLRLRWATVQLADADLSAPSILSGSPTAFPYLAEDEFARRWKRLPPEPGEQRWRPRLLSVRRADLAGLRLADIDLRACRFAGAHHLDQLTLEGVPMFARAPGWWRARRATLAEEQHWRASRRRHHRGWHTVACQFPRARVYQSQKPPQPAQITALYRELRKAREDAKDEPGAADFYYGEMEMRRNNRAGPRAERAVLWAYWLVSGYALRAWRALATLSVVLAVASGLLLVWGLPRSTEPRGGAVGVLAPAGAGQRLEVTVREPDTTMPRSAVHSRLAWSRWWKAVWVSGNAAVFRSAEPTLTVVGRITEMCTRILGPLLLGLALLSVRNRVKR